MTEFDLKRAYGNSGAGSAKAFYADWAGGYDSGFAQCHGYVAPQKIASIFLKENDGDTPILDIGAGTGLVAEHLGGETVDAFDLTPEMLDVARGKGLYRALYEGDLLKPLALPDAAYRGVICCGTFTHGHVGPACLPELLRVTRPGGLFVCGSVPEVFDGMGFGSTLARLQAAGQITPVRFREITIYDNADHDHADDRVLVMIFRKT